MFTTIPQYFFGDGIQQAKNDSVEDIHTSEPNLSRIPSPASSLASTKKLEWDSGADIGYIVYNSLKNSRKSKSFPSLNNMDLSISQINKSNESQGDEMSLENKVTDDVIRENVIKNQESKSKNSFKHSTPNEDKIVGKISKYKVHKNNKDECLQTTLIKNCSKSIQTENNIVSNERKVNKSQQTDTLISQSSSSGSSLSKSSSFQYIPVCAKSNSSERSNMKTDSHRSSEKSGLEACKSKSTESNSDIKSKMSNSSQSTERSCSSTSPLGKMIATQQSKHLIKDIDKSLYILQRFIKSKNYTSDTKKYYARKIMNKIIAAKYSEDSSSNSGRDSNLSEDIQNKENIKSTTVSCGIQCSLIQNNEATESSKNAKLAQKLEEIINKETRNVNSNEQSSIKLKNTQSSRTTSCGVQCALAQNNVATETSKNAKITKKLEEIINKNDKATIKLKNKSETGLSTKNWREPETLSEKLFEARRKSTHSSQESSTPEQFKKVVTKIQRNYLIQHSKNEKMRQLSWINNEILYLHKLKELLQNIESTTNSSLVNTESKNTSPESSNKHESSNSTKHTISDIEARFYQEFGSNCSENNIEHLKKISKYFNNEQLKFLLCNSSNSDKETKDISQNNEEINSPEIEKKSTLQELDEQDNSYCSHTHKFYEHPMTKSKHSSSKQMEKKVGKSNVSIQYTLKKKRQKEYSNESDSCESENIQIHFKNELLNTDSERIVISEESESVVEYESSSEKENYYKKIPHRRRVYNKPFKPIAYYLTFDEQKINLRHSIKKNKLEQITVKIPKLVTPKKNRKHSADQTLTLQEYLAKNRPNFIETADWRQSIISDRSERKSKNIFTCAQMKELTTKKYQQLPEVQNKKHSCKESVQRRQNRFMASMFSKKLQKKTLRGQMSIATCINVLSDS